MKENNKSYLFYLGLVIFIFVLFLAIILIVKLNSVSLINNNDTLSDVTIQDNSEENVSRVSDIEKVAIDEYIQKIYKRFELIIPEFEDINDADPQWLWSVVFSNAKTTKDTGNYTVDAATEGEMNEKAKELFSEKLNIKLDKNTKLYFVDYSKENDWYENVGRGGEYNSSQYVIDNVLKENDKIYVNILEYTIQFPTELEATEGVGSIYIFNDDKKIIEYNESDVSSNAVINYSSNYVLQNKEKFKQRQLVLRVENSNFYVEAVKII